MIKKLFGDIRRLRFDGATEAAEEILPNRRPSTIQNFGRLKLVAQALKAVWDDFAGPNSRGEKSHRCDISPAPNAGKENILKTCKAEKYREQRPMCTTPEQFAHLATRPFREIIKFYWNASEGGGPLSWRTIELAARDY